MYAFDVIHFTITSNVVLTQDWRLVGDVHSVRRPSARRYVVGSRNDRTGGCTFKVCAGQRREIFWLQARTAQEARRWIQSLLVAFGHASRSGEQDPDVGVVVYV